MTNPTSFWVFILTLKLSSHVVCLYTFAFSHFRGTSAFVKTLLFFPPLQFDSEEQFNCSVKTLLSRLPKQRYLKCICEEIHSLKITKKYVIFDFFLQTWLH